MASSLWMLAGLFQRLVIGLTCHGLPAADECICRGFTFCFGMFQDYYQTFLPGKTSSEISWIGTLASYLLIVVGTISGPLFDLGHYKVMLFGGAAVTCFGIMMLSLSTQYYQIVLTQGICTGLGCGLLYIPGIALTSRSFSRRRAVALGLVSCGAPFGKNVLSHSLRDHGSYINKVESSTPLSLISSYTASALLGP